MGNHQHRTSKPNFNSKTEFVELSKIGDLIDMIHSELNPPEELENEELVEVLEVISKEAFTETEVFSIGFGKLTKSTLKI